MADGYTVGTGKEDVVLNPNGGGFKDVWEFPITVTDGPARGTHFTVKIDATDLSPDAVHNAVADQLAILEGIHSR
jgi:hypothetical protein